MAKINYLFVLLLLSFIGIYPGTDGDIVRAGSKDRNTVKQIYDSQLGVLERGSNAGPDVEKYLRYVGLAKGNPWCAAFVCWVYGKAGVPNPRTGWSPALFTKKNVIWSRSKQLKLPNRADIFAIYFPEKGRIAHTGFIDSWGSTWVITVEGNTNAEGNREGDGVYRKRRLVKSIYQVARYVP